MMTIRGTYFDGKTAVSKDVNLVINESKEIIGRAAEETLFQYALKDIVFNESLTSSEGSLQLPNGGLFKTEDQRALDFLAASAGQQFMLKAIRKKPLLIGLLAALAFLFVLTSYLIFIPEGSLWLSTHLPKSFWQELGEFTTQKIRSEHFAIEDLDQEDQNKLNSVFKRYAAIQKNVGTTILISNKNQFKMNAFTTTNNNILLTPELIESCTAEEIFAIILHETGHAYFHHPSKIFIQQSIMGFFTVAVLGNKSGQMNSSDLMNSHFSQEVELEADHFAVEQLKKSGLSPLLLAQALQKMSQNNKQENLMIPFLSTHPSTEKRVEIIKKWINEKPKKRRNISAF